MTLIQKRNLIAALAVVFLLSLVLVQRMEVVRRATEAGELRPRAAVPASSRACVDCHGQISPAIVSHWRDSGHALTGVGCVECHRAEPADVDAHQHYGAQIATIVTPLDCGRCHLREDEEFERSHHSAAGNILASLDNFLAETVEGARAPFDPHGEPPGRGTALVNGLASAQSGCQQCHGSKVALLARGGGVVTVDDLRPDPLGRATNLEAVARIEHADNGRPLLHSGTWPNTGIGRLNLDGSRGSCSACHSRHDFSPRRARQPENCGKCHLGPDHPQKEIYEESKHGVAYRDLRDELNLDAPAWVLGVDYSQAPTCATCHMSGHSRNGGRVTHDPGERISWTNSPPVSLVMDTDEHQRIVTAADPIERQRHTADTWENKRNRMREVCGHCHTPDYVSGFYRQYDDLVVLYNEKFAKPGQRIVSALEQGGLLTKAQFDEEIEWTWFYLWHHEGRRARHGAAMMAPDYTHWHGMFEVAERYYVELVPQARELIAQARARGQTAGAAAAARVLDEVLARPEHAWFSGRDAASAEAIRRAMAERYGQGGGPDAR